VCIDRLEIIDSSVGGSGAEKKGEEERAMSSNSNAVANGLAGAGGGIVAQIITYPLQTVLYSTAAHTHTLLLPALTGLITGSSSPLFITSSTSLSLFFF
jgi:hypothetical protein